MKWIVVELNFGTNVLIFFLILILSQNTTKKGYILIEIFNQAQIRQSKNSFCFYYLMKVNESSLVVAALKITSTSKDNRILKGDELQRPSQWQTRQEDSNGNKKRNLFSYNGEQ